MLVPNNMNSNKKPLLILGIAIFLVLLVFIFIGALFFTPGRELPSQPKPSPTGFALPLKDPQNYKASPLQKTTIGETTEEEIEKEFNVEDTEDLGQGKTKFVVESGQAGRTAEVITQNGKVISETTVTQVSTQRPFPDLQEFIKLFGQPEKVISGNSRYGWPINSYLFPSKGYMVVANKFTNEIYEIHRFTPMSLSQYEQTYADYIIPMENEGL